MAMKMFDDVCDYSMDVYSGEDLGKLIEGDVVKATYSHFPQSWRKRDVVYQGETDGKLRFIHQDYNGDITIDGVFKDDLSFDKGAIVIPYERDCNILSESKNGNRFEKLKNILMKAGLYIE